MTTTAQSLLPDFVVKQGMINSCLTRGADYEIYTGSMKVDENADPGKYVVTMIGSSTVKDLQGDVMALSALEDMTKIPDNLTIWLNHDYTVPSSVLGGLIGRPWLMSQSGIADLHFAAEIESSNPIAMQTYTMINRGRRLGCSIGCQVLDYDYDEKTQTIIIKSVYTVEFSCVGVPASQRCWVEVAAKSLFERSLLEGNADKALQLAPAVRGMYWRAYDSVVKHVEVTSLRNDLERVRPRDTADHRIMHVFNDGEINFALSDTKGIRKSLTREEVAGLLEQKHVEHKPIVEPQLEQKVGIAQSADTTDIQTNDATSEDLDTKSVSGNTSFPLMDIGTEWDGSKAESQIFAYAKGDDGEINVSKAKQGFLYYDPDNSDTQKGYKMPFCYIVNGSPKIVPKGVQTCAGVLNGSMGGVDAPGDQAGMKAKVKTMYGRINSQFKPDPAWQVPWEKEDKSMDGIETKAKEKDGIADSETDGPLNRQDISEETPADDKDDNKTYPKASDVKISANGTHEACKGVHTHAHSAFSSQGDDKTHEHSHEHNGDSDHNHPHNEKATEPEVTKTQDEVQTSETITTPTDDKALPEIDPKRQSLLTIYNNLGAELGLDAVTLDKQKGLMPIADGVDMQEVVTRLSLADSQIDWLMAVFGVPDIDTADDNGAMTTTQPTTPFAWNLPTTTTKAGREISAKNGAIVQKIMHCSMALGASCPSCGATGVQSETVDEATDEARMQGEGQPIQQYPSMAGDTLNNSIEAINNLTKSLEAMTVKSIVKSEIDAVLDESRKSLEALRLEQRTLIDNIRKLKELPLGRPTAMLGRTVVQEEGTASYDEMRQAGVNMLEQSEDDLEVISRGGIKYKRWPISFKKDQRPALTSYQLTHMSPLDYPHYMQATRDVWVPILDTPMA